MKFSGKSNTSLNVAGTLLALQNRIMDAVSESCGIVVDEARTYCAVDTGELVSSIGTESIERVGPNTVVGTVTANAPHAMFVEYGTGLRGEGTYPYDLPTEGVPITGEWVYDYKDQGWQGHAAQPYMRPALDTARPQIIAKFGSAVKL